MLDPEPKRLLVAVDAATGEARGLHLFDSEELCTANAPLASADVKSNERVECREAK